MNVKTLIAKYECLNCGEIIYFPLDFNSKFYPQIWEENPRITWEDL